MNDTVHLIVESGEDQGRRISVPARGATLGRSSRNEICVHDPSLSRKHCRLFFNDQQQLWISDQDSANETLVNGKPVRSAPLHVGDRIAVGATLLKVLHDGRRAALRVQRDAPPAPVTRARPLPADIPLCVRGAVWAVVFLWWLFAAYSLLQITIESIPRHVENAPVYRPPEAMETSGERGPAPVHTEPPGPPAVPDEGTRLRLLKEGAAQHLLARDYQQALATVRHHIGDAPSDSFRAEADRVRAFIEALSRVEAVLLDSFRSRMGKETRLRFENRDLTVIPMAASGDKVTVRIAGSDPVRTLTFRVPELAPLECSRLLGTADTPYKAGMKFLMHMAAGDHAEASRLADGCGPMADVFRERVAADQRVEP